MTDHSPSELHATTGTRADEGGLFEVEPSALQAVYGGDGSDPGFCGNGGTVGPHIPIPHPITRPVQPIDVS
jgi:hypothetical protein